jgi:hypothetical protein
LFGWEEIEELGDLERLRLVLGHLPDELLMLVLGQEQGRGRDEYPVRAVWNSVVAGVVFQHESVEGLRRELQRNGQLRQMCCFDLLKGEGAVPSSWEYTRFLKKLMGQVELIKGIFDHLVEELRTVLPDFDRILALDSKALESHGRKVKAGSKGADGRGENDADYGRKSYPGVREDRTLWEKMKRWFGFKANLAVEANHELPVGWEVTRASEGDIKGAVRIPLSEDWRIFTPLARSSYAWKREYGKRRAVERVNSRLDVFFGFERHFIRGLKKMKVRMGLALGVMLSLALGRVKENRMEKMRSLVWSKAA